MRWREIGPYLRELWQRPAGPMNWKNPIRVFAVLGWLVVARFRAVGVGRVSRVSRFPTVGVGRVSRRAIRCRASAAATLFLRRCGVGRMELCTPALPAARRTPDPCFGRIPHPQFLRCSGRLVLRYALRCRHADRLYFRHHLEGLAGRAAERFRLLLQAPAVAA